MESNQLGPGVGPGGVEDGEEVLRRSWLFLIYGWRLLKSRRNGINSVWKSCREEKPKCWAGAFAGGHRPEIQAVEDRAGDEWCRERSGTEKAGMSHPSLERLWWKCPANSARAEGSAACCRAYIQALSWLQFLTSRLCLPFVTGGRSHFLALPRR